MNWIVRKIFLFLFWGSVIFSSLIAAFSVSVGQLLPYLDYYRPQIERNLEQITGHTITLDQIDGRMEGIDPTISVSGFHLQSGGQSAISIDEVRIRFDLVKSILNLQPRFTYIRFVGPTVALQEVDGQWLLDGAKPLSAVRNEVGVERVLDYLSAQRNFSILDAKIEIVSDRFGKHDLDIPHVYIFQEEFGSLVKSTFYLDDYELPFEINARIDEAFLLGNYQVKASLKVPEISLPLREMFPQMPFPLTSIELGGDVWLDASIDQEVEVRAESTHVKIAFNDGQSYEATPSIKARYVQNDNNLRVDIRDINILDSVDIRYPTTDLVFERSFDSGRSVISFNEVDLGLTHQMLSYFLPKESSGKKLLNGISPQGIANNGSFQFWRENNSLSFHFLSNLMSASVNGYNGIPTADNINAIFSLSNDSGYIDFKGKESQLGFNTVYKDVWSTQLLSGYVDWRRQQDVFLLSGRDLNVQRNNAAIHGGFRLELRNDSPDWISLDLHADNVPVNDRLAYVPDNALGGSLRSWIEDSFADVGQADTADVLIHSNLIKEAKPHVRVQVAAEDLDISFHDDWPMARNVNGVFEFNQTGVSVQVNSASLLELPIDDVLITVPINDGVANWLNIKGQIKEDASALLTNFRQTPLSATVLSPFDDWEIKGDVEGEFHIGIPFLEGGQPKVDLSLVFQKNSLSINTIGLDSYIQKGNLNYDTSIGITNSRFEIEALGGESLLTLSSSENADSSLAILGDIHGSADVSEFASWQNLSQSAVKKISGMATYNGKLLINQAQQGQVDLEIYSNLEGVSIDLPEPIGKKTQEKRELHFKMVQHKDDLIIDTDYSQLAKARVLLKAGEFMGGEIILNAAQGQNLNSNVPEGLVLVGSFERFYLQEWQSILSDLSNDNSAFLNNEEILVLPKWLNRINLIVDEVIVNPNNTLANFKVAYDSNSGKSLYVNSDEISFSILNENGRPNLNFDFLSWNTEPSNKTLNVTSKNKTIPAPLAASQIPNMLISIDQLYINKKPYGDWQLNVVRDGNKVSLDPISTKLQHGNFNSRLVWLDRGNKSNVTFLMKADGEDLSELTGKLSNDAFVSSKQYKIDVELNWKGHPFYFDRESVSGDIRFSAENGNFNKVDELPPFLKILGVFNAGALTRRLSLDFSDMYQPGLTYDDFNGELSLKNGVLKTLSPITINSPSAILSLDGTANIVEETLDELLTATFPLTGTLPIAGLLWGTPQLAGLLYITDKLIGDQISKVTSVQYKVEGSFNNPKMTPVKYRPLNQSNE